MKSVLPTNYLSQVRSHQVAFDTSKKILSIEIGITGTWSLSSLAGASLHTMPLINPMFWSLMLTHDSLTRAFTPLYSCSEISLSHLSLHISRVNWNVILWCLHFHPSFWINWLFKMSFYACRLSGFSCVQLFNSMDYSPSGFSVNEFLQERILECHALLQGSFCSSLYLSFSLKVPQRYKSLLVLTMPKPLTVWITINWGKFWKRWEYQNTWSASWEICMQDRKQQLELDMEQQTGSK